MRGGADVDPRRPRVTVLARGQAGGAAPGAGWGRLCRLVTQHPPVAASAAPPVSSAALLARARAPTARNGDRLALTRAARPRLRRRPRAARATTDRARALLHAWLEVLPRGSIVVEVVHHGGPRAPRQPGHAARLLGLAAEAGLPAVLTAAVRHADPGTPRPSTSSTPPAGSSPLDPRHLDRVTDRGPPQPDRGDARRRPRGHPRRPGVPARPGARLARRLLRDPWRWRRLRPGPRTDLGIGAVHLPEPVVLGIVRRRPAGGARGAVPRGDRHPLPRASHRRPARSWSAGSRTSSTSSPGWATRPTSSPSPRSPTSSATWGCGSPPAARGPAAWSTTCSASAGSTRCATACSWSASARRCGPQLPDIDIDVESARRTEIYERILDRFGGDRVTCVSMMDTYRVRHAIRDVGAALGPAPGRDRRDRQGVPAHPRP